MEIKVGFEISYAAVQQTPMVIMLSIHPSRFTDIVGTATPRAAELEDVLDGLRTSVFLADSDGRVLHANAAGNEMLAEGDAMRTRNGRLSPSDLTAATALSRALEAAGNGTLPAGDSGHGISMTASDGGHFALHLLPLNGHDKRASAGAAAAIFVQRTQATTIAPDLVGRAFGLTPAEQRVLSHIVEAGSVAEAAERLRVSETTVKTHLHRVFSKTGTARQADLVKLLTGFAGPLR